ncbi:NAD(P)-dependent oxidoreductase [Candidatus Pacearchaeota archaeon]|jgi:nucleoside-diphosphate-sugar epimerase|nr:NAD(P)-dependent oxidoreductase [Candidatus Pacearchaeota archaeon]
MSNILLTGATGFIGQNMARSLVEKGNNVRCLVRMNSDSTYLRGLGVDLTFGDVSDADSVMKAAENIDIVYHLAAIRGELNSIDYETYRRVNVGGTQNLLDASIKRNINKFVYCSSVGVIGWWAQPPADEDTPCRATGKYHITKLEAEKLVQSYCNSRGLNGTIIRPVITYGNDKSGFILNLAKLIKAGRFRVIGNGNNYMHLVSIKNLVSGFMLAENNPRSKGRTYIIADECPITINDLASIIAGSMNAKIPTVKIPLILAKVAGMGCESVYKFLRPSSEPLVTSAKVGLLSKNRFYSISRAKEELGYSPYVGTREGVADTIRFYTNNGWL